METGQLFGSNPEVKITSQKPKKTTQRNHKTDDKMDISWHTFHSPKFQWTWSVTILGRAFLEATNIFQILLNSTRQILAQAREENASQVKTFFTCQASSSPPPWSTTFFLQTSVIPAFLLHVSAQSHLSLKSSLTALLETAASCTYSTCQGQIYHVCLRLICGLPPRDPWGLSIKFFLHIPFSHIYQNKNRIPNVFGPLILLSMPQKQWWCPQKSRLS